MEEKFSKELKKNGLRYLSDSGPGLMRQKIGKGFGYYDEDGNRIKDEKVLKRIDGLVIPPAWENVWISPSPHTHIQVTGFDEKGRKQYIYHPDWIAICQQDKFKQLKTFGKVLPRIRRKVREDLKGKSFEKKTILATVVWLLEHTFIRVGNDEYVKENGSYGLTTLRRRHIDLSGRKIKLAFKGKSGIAHEVEITHPKIIKIIKKCIELPGYEVFQYLDDEGERHSVDSEDVNNYLQEISGEEITAKDFRTWGATLLCASLLKDCPPPENETQFKKITATAIKSVSTHLRNTPSVCRCYYVHPKVLETFKNHKLPDYFKKIRNVNGLGITEVAVLTLITKSTT